MIVSSTDEDLRVHITGAIDEWRKIYKRIVPSLSRLVSSGPTEVNKATEMMLVFHDVGKMTYKWQNAMTNVKKTRPPHAQLSAAFIWKYLKIKDPTLREELRYPIIFATLIHHTGRSFITDNLERPDVIVIRNGLAYDNGGIKWHDEAQTYVDDLSKQATIEPMALDTVRVHDLRSMSRELRTWSLGNELRLNHRNRLIASAFHQVLKTCDIRSARSRKDWDEENSSPIVEKITRGGLIP